MPKRVKFWGLKAQHDHILHCEKDMNLGTEIECTGLYMFCTPKIHILNAYHKVELLRWWNL